MAKKENTLRVISAKALLSYPHLDEPQPAENGKKPKYSCSLVFTPALLADPAEKALFDKMAKALQDAIEAKWPGKSKQMLAAETFKRGFRRDAEAKGYPEGSIFVNVRSEQRPHCVDAQVQRIPVENVKATLYPGAIVRASLTAYGYDVSGNKGVTFGLNNIQKLADGERLDNRAAPEDEFTVDLSAAPANLEDLIS